MDRRFLLTFSYKNDYELSANYKWYKTEKEMLEDIEAKKDTMQEYEVSKAMEILNVRDIWVE